MSLLSSQKELSNDCGVCTITQGLHIRFSDQAKLCHKDNRFVFGRKKHTGQLSKINKNMAVIVNMLVGNIFIFWIKHWQADESK